ncbi:hypothetical protein Ddye_025940 [Dipteronia dyeriana]|uniref:Uncharacterized protein n=1 Tax=Dipteronia dyeriana TaxID=168575 RepID=A0AAD9WQ24_9ROSI|nr:hypothetical protein Ddye_025940 [Dipteronia dyeriana]
MAEKVHKKYDFIDPYDPRWDGTPYEAKPTDKPYFVEYANQLKTTEGFHVDLIPKSILCTWVIPYNVDSKYTVEAANSAVDEFNRLDGLFYEAKIDIRFLDESYELVMFRPAKYWPRPRKDTKEGGVVG